MSGSDDIVTLSAADYAVFGVMLAVSAVVGLFFAYRDRKQKSVENYLLGDRKISPWAAGFSASLSFMSGVSVIGIPAEIFYFGGSYVWIRLANLLAMIICCEMFLPVYHRLGLSSANEYYTLRFGKVTGYIATSIYLIQTVTYSGVAIYAPALALNAVSDFSLWGGILSIGIVCTLYTTMGGLRAVIWTDVIQGIILFIVLVLVLFKSADTIGGLGKVLDVAEEGLRLDFFHFEFDPRYRMTFWGATFGYTILTTSIISTNQSMVQRFICCRSVMDGKKALYSSFIFGTIDFALLCIIGFTTYAYFADCDPLLSGKTSAGDQIVPYMVLEVFEDIPGLSGLFITGIFAAALSTISSAINGMSCVTVGDLIKPNVQWSDGTLLWVSRGSTLIYGGLCIAFAFLASVMGSLIQAVLSLLGICAGALLGPIVMGTLFPFTNDAGAISGMIAAFAINIWIYVGSTIYPPPSEFTRRKNLTVEGCPKVNATLNATVSSSMMFTTAPLTSTTMAPNEERPPIAELYAVSFMYYSLIGLAMCMSVGMIVSCATGGLNSRYKVDPKLINLPFDHVLLRWLPRSFRRFMVPKMGRPEDFKPDSIDHDNEKYYQSQNGEMKHGMEKSNCHANLACIDDEETISTSL